MNDRLPDSPPPDSTREVAVLRLGPKGSQAVTDRIAAEVPIALVFNGISHAVMMATPADLEAFALGFALSEGLLDSRAECHGIDVIGNAEGVEIQIEVAAAAEMRLKEKRRSLVGRTGCGLCGIDSLKQLDLLPEGVAPAAWVGGLQAPTVLRAFAQLPSMQPLNAQTGAHHASAWVTPEGEVTTVMEDVGRHNALDKLLGRLARAGRLEEPGFVLMSSRGSHELVRKCGRLGIAAMATISAPTAMGVRMAELSGLRFWGLCRAPRGVLYADGLPPPSNARTASATASMP
jgi:FdhD protein